jgi:hypothetical protein
MRKNIQEKHIVFDAEEIARTDLGQIRRDFIHINDIFVKDYPWVDGYTGFQLICPRHCMAVSQMVVLEVA